MIGQKQSDELDDDATTESGGEANPDPQPETDSNDLTDDEIEIVE